MPDPVLTPGLAEPLALPTAPASFDLALSSSPTSGPAPPMPDAGPWAALAATLSPAETAYLSDLPEGAWRNPAVWATPLGQSIAAKVTPPAPEPPPSAQDAVQALGLGDPSTYLPPTRNIRNPDNPDNPGGPRLAVSHGGRSQGTIGAARVGDRYVPPTFNEILTSSNPFQGLVENVLGPARPASVAAQDPYGILANQMGAGPPPMLVGSTEAVGEAGAGVTRGLFSRLEQAAEQLPAKGAHPNRVASLLRSQVSAEELAHRRVPEFLAAQGQTPVTREALQAHLQAHPAPVPTPVVLREAPLPEGILRDYLASLGEPAPADPAGWQDLANRLMRRAQARQQRGHLDEAQQLFALGEEAQIRAEDLDLGTGSAGAPKFAQYQLPGGEAYRENLLTLPDRQPFDPSKVRIERSRLSETQGSAEPFYDGVSLGRFEDTIRLNRETRRYEGRSDADWTDVVRRRYGGDPTMDVKPLDRGANFRGKHWSQPNVVAHTRSNERTVPGWGRGHFLEEVQSDWHQAGKEHGYATPDPELRAARDAANRAHTATADALSEARARVRDMARDDPGRHAAILAVDEASAANDAAYERLRALNDRHYGRVPDAPFKEQWPDLALKHHLLEAAHDPQAEWLGFTGGATQADRYDLSKQVSAVHWYPQRQTLEVIRKGAQLPVEIARGVTADKLAGHIGKEAADKLQQAPMMSGAHVLDGLDLQVGGKGMAHFYDALLPKRLAQILQPFGGTVERMQLPAGIEGHRGTRALGEAFFDAAHPSQLVDGQLPAGHLRTRYTREGLGEAFAAGRVDAYDFPQALQDRVKKIGIPVPAWAARLTPAIKAALREGGLPLMSLAPPLAVAHKATTPAEDPAVLARVATRFPNFAQALRTHPPTPPPAQGVAGTHLGPADEARFQQWVRANGITDLDHPDSHYDYRGFWKKYPEFHHRPGEHYTDEFKLPGHLSFSAESRYATPENFGGRWDADTYVPQLATSRSSVVPTQLGQSVRGLAQGEVNAPPRRAGEATIGAARVGDRYVPPSFKEILTSDNPLQGILENLLGPARPRSVQAKDPYGAEAYLAGTGPAPGLMLGSTGEVGEAVTQAARGLTGAAAHTPVVEPVVATTAEAKAHFDLAPAERIDGRLFLSTRVPEGPKALRATGGAPLTTGVADIARDPVLLGKIAAKLRDDPMLARYRTLSDRGVLDAAVEMGAKNIDALIHMQPADQVARSRGWYEGAHDMADRAAARVGVTGDQGAGVFASQSPSKEWNQNVELAHRIMDAWHAYGQADPVFTQAMFDQHAKTALASGERWIKTNHLVGEEAAAYRALRAKAIEGTSAYVGHRWLGLPVEVQAKMTRAADELAQAQTYPIFSPDGRVAHPLALNQDGTPSTLVWQSNKFVTDALAILHDPSPVNISKHVGRGHKVRSFFNNINVPRDPRSVTADTHNVGGTHFRPMGGTAPEVMAVMGGSASKPIGIKGAHGVYRDAAILASQANPELGLRPNQVQSVSWESIKGLFSPAQRTDPVFVGEVRRIWDEFARGKIKIEELHARIHDLAGGLDAPDWAPK